MDNVSTKPLLYYACSISTQTTDKDGNPKTFSIHVGDTGKFSTTVLKLMPVSKDAGKYLMRFNPDIPELTIRPLVGVQHES